MIPAGSLVLITGLMACLLTPLRSFSQYSSEHIFWEKDGSSGYYQNKEGAVFHIAFPEEKESKVLDADKLMPTGAKEPLHLLFYLHLPKQGAKLFFSDKKVGEQYNNRDRFWSYQTESKKLRPIEKPLTAKIINLANIHSFYGKGNTWLDNNQPDSATRNYQSGIDLSGRLDNFYLEARGFYLQSLMYIKVNALDSAQQVLNKALDIFEKSGMQKDVAACYNNFSIIFRRLGDFPKALNYGLKALRGNEHLRYKPGISRALSSVGNVYLRTGHLDEALSNFTRALIINNTIGNPAWITNSLLNIGVSYQKKRVLDSALLNYRKALQLARQLNNKLDERVLLTNIGSLLRETGKRDSSIIYLNEALAIARKYDFERAHLLNDIVETYLQSGQPKKAKTYALLAINAAEREQNPDQLQFAWLIFSRANASLGDYQSAYRAMKEHGRVKDSVFNMEKMKVLNQLRIKYETEKKEQVITELTRQRAEARFRRNTYLVSGILIAIILLLLFNRQRMKSRKNRELYEKERELEQMKSTFFSNISHEFRTPLTLILGPIQSLRDNMDNPDVTRQLNMMERNAQRLLGLIDQLLHLSKLESAKIELFSGRQDIIILIRGNVMNFSSLAASRKIDLSIKTHLHSLVMDFDKEKMETIFINLLSNAFKFTPDGGFIKVYVEKEESEKEKNLVIRVQDSGAGILEKDIPYVFDRYYQGEEGQKLFRAGSGIGLAMTKELVQLHNGTIEIVSRHGEGTEVKITMPMGENYVLQELPAEEGNDLLDKTSVIAAEKIAALKQEDKEKPIVLVIEDNVDVMNYLKDVLQKDYVILFAEDGEEGIAKALQEIPDLIISDVMMPKKDGYEVCDALRQDERTSHVPLILLTAKAGHEDKLQGLSKKADEYITKPFYPRELLLIAGNLIDSRKALQAKYRKELMLKPMNITIPSMEEAFLQKLMQIVEENMDEEGFTVEKLAAKIGMSRSQLHRKLQALTNQSATEFIRYYRLSRAKEMLQHHVGTIAEIGYKVGFGSPSYFNKMFLQQYGITPGKVRSEQS